MRFRRLPVVAGVRAADTGGIDRISSLIAGTLAKRGLATHALSSLALHRVNAWLDERFPGMRSPAVAEKVADGTLFITCVHSVVLQELQLRLPELRRFLATECPFAAITDIRLSRGTGGAGNALAPENPPA